MAKIQGSVGSGGRNLQPDVIAVQTLLRDAGLDPGPVNGECGQKTIDAITQFQCRFLAHPDGRVDPEGITWRKLTAGVGDSGPATGSDPATLAEWSGDSAQWPQEKKLASLEPNFRAKVQVVVSSLREQGFQPKIVYGWRSVEVQQRLVAEGKSKVRFSFHNAQKPDGTPNAYAADIVDERWGWGDDAQTNGFWRALGDAAKDQGLVWGGDWVEFPDVAHVQGRRNSELAAVKEESGL